MEKLNENAVIATGAEMGAKGDNLILWVYEIPVLKDQYEWLPIIDVNLENDEEMTHKMKDKEYYFNLWPRVKDSWSGKSRIEKIIGEKLVELTENTAEEKNIINNIKIIKCKEGGIMLIPLGEFNAKDAKEAAAAYGYNVSEAAFIHNYEAYIVDFKSGYLDDDVFVFTPCRCNPLKFSIEKKNGALYQETYVA